MVYCSTVGRKKVFHNAGCRCVSRIKECNKRVFKTKEEARAAGYTECSCCSIMGKHYNKERNAVEAFCKEHSIQHFYYDNVLYFISSEDTAWKIVQGGKSSTAFFLYHESIKGQMYVRRNTSYLNRKYHSQKVRRRSILAYLEYILAHDVYMKGKEYVIPDRKFSSSGSKKAKKAAKKEKKIQRKKSIKRTIWLINNLSESYIVPHTALV